MLYHKKVLQMFLNIKITLFVILSFTFNYSFASEETNRLKLSNTTVKSFYNYISNDRRQLDKFLVTEDGSSSFVWVCPQTICFPASSNFYLKPCEKYNKKKKCKIFALNRKIKLINSDKMPANLLKFNQSDSLLDVKKKLKKLGFID